MEHNRDPNVVQLGDIVQYVWGWPGPDYCEGSVIAIHDDGTFDIQFAPNTMSGSCLKDGRKTGAKLADRENDRTGVLKVTRAGINGF